MANNNFDCRSILLEWLDGRIKECEDMGITTSIALNAEVATLRDVRKFVDGLTSAGREEAV
jgi:hypothetical protein